MLRVSMRHWGPSVALGIPLELTWPVDHGGQLIERDLRLEGLPDRLVDPHIGIDDVIALVADHPGSPPHGVTMWGLTFENQQRGDGLVLAKLLARRVHLSNVGVLQGTTHKTFHFHDVSYALSVVLSERHAGW